MNKQVFQTDNRTRWNKFKWILRIIFFISLIFLTVFVVMMIIDSIPNLPVKNDYRGVVAASKPFLQETKYSKEYKGFRSFISDKALKNNYEVEKGKSLSRYRRSQDSSKSLNAGYFNATHLFSAPIRSAYYVTWDPKSYLSLKKNIKNINLIVPEWFFIDNLTNQFTSNIDSKGFALMKSSGVAIMPMLSNNIGQKFRPEPVVRILSSAQKSQALIDSTINTCIKNGFIGINLDFEALSAEGIRLIPGFIKKMSEQFHQKGLLLTLDVLPFNRELDASRLTEYVDYFFLMAYDEYSVTSDPGPISSQKWIEAAVDNFADKVPDNKIVLGMGAYGYEWCQDDQQNMILSYQDAISKASGTGAAIKFDNDTYNLNYAFSDNDTLLHQVYFTDAATQFNIMRFGCEYGLAGFSIWRMGSEDDRVWKFYAKNLIKSAVHSEISKTELESTSPLNNNIDYIGNGEILDVLNTPHDGNIEMEIDSTEMLIAEETYSEIPSGYQVMKYGQAGNKQLLLTFDDGPDPVYTPQILDILKQYNIKAAFFMVGIQAEKNLPLVKEIYQQGHMIGNHTFTHRNVAENTPERTYVELKLTRMLIECVTGHSTILFRAPYNADSEPVSIEEIIPVVLARQQNYLDVGESIDPDDWQVGIKAEEIFKRVVAGVERTGGHIIILHDSGGESREETVKALPLIINYYLKRGYTFTTLPVILGKTPEQLMPSIPKGKEYYAMQANFALASFVYGSMNFLNALFFIFIVLGIGRLIFMIVLTVREKRKDKKLIYNKNLLKNAPHVSVIVPAYNEEVNAVSSLNNLLLQDYPDFDVIFVDDGSKDETHKRVNEAFKDNPKVKVYTKPNGGKASALNFGIEHTDAEYVVCIDADTKLYLDAISVMMLHFLENKSDNIGAVAGNVKVGNQVNLLTKWQAIEYTTSQNFDRLAYSNINAITVVPGAIGAFKRKAITDAGGLTTDTLAEDCDLTIRINRAGYSIENENKAVAMTEAPERIRQFVKQRTRWTFGVMQTFWKNRDLLCVKKYKGLGLWAMPNMLVFQFFIPVFSSLADLFMFIGLFSGNAARIALYYLIFTLVDSSISIAAYIFEREKLSVLLWIIPQRFFYRWIMYVVLFKSYKRAIKGELQTWGVLKRTGNVADITKAAK